MLPYTWVLGLGKIPGIGRGSWKNSELSGGGVWDGGSQILGLEGTPEKRHETGQCRILRNNECTINYM